MRLALIPPVKYLPRLYPLHGAGTASLVLSHWLRDDPDYSEFYTQTYRKEFRDPEDMVILDNSAHELGFGQSVDKLLYNTRQIKPDMIVLPDRLFFGEDTVEMSTECCQLFSQEFPTVKRMGVPQGRTRKEYSDCLKGLLDLGVDMIGVSKDFEVWDGGLYWCVEQVPPDIPIHMLGWGRDLRQPMIIARNYHNVKSIDTAKPFVYALGGIELRPISRFIPEGGDWPRYPKRPERYLSQSLEGSMVRVVKNIRVFAQACEDEDRVRWCDSYLV